MKALRAREIRISSAWPFDSIEALRIGASGTALQSILPIMPRVLLLLPSSTYRAPDFIAAAEELGAEVLVASDALQAIAPLMAVAPPAIDCARPEAAAAATTEVARGPPLGA